MTETSSVIPAPLSEDLLSCPPFQWPQHESDPWDFYYEEVEASADTVLYLTGQLKSVSLLSMNQNHGEPKNALEEEEDQYKWEKIHTFIKNKAGLSVLPLHISWIIGVSRGSQSEAGLGKKNPVKPYLRKQLKQKRAGVMA
jgi:hypothetical protein